MKIISMTTMAMSLLPPRVQSFILAVLMMAATVGTILLIAFLINRHLTKKEQEQEQNKKDK